MAKIRLLVHIAAPRNLVGAFFVPQRMIYWYGREMDSRLEIQRDAGEFQVGQRVRVVGRLGRREVSLVGVVTGYERSRLFEWRFRDAHGVAGMQSWEIEQVGAGSRVHMRDEYEMPGSIGKFRDRCFTRYAVRARDRRDLERLKQLAERRE